ncbi:MAG: hypothetical protein JWM58_3509 [Rhizobium sp.]|nr:hypothetical protein [Rhizobium sp.]
MASVSFSLRRDLDLKHRLEEAAQSEDRSPKDIASDAIAAFLDAREFKKAEIEAALAEADKGIFVFQEAVDRWMDSWDADNELPMPEPDIFPANEQK